MENAARGHRLGIQCTLLMFLLALVTSLNLSSSPEFGLSRCTHRNECFVGGGFPWKGIVQLIKPNVSDRNCYCDRLCVVYADCCLDIYQSIDNGTNPWGDYPILTQHSTDTFSCMQTDDALKLDFIYVVNKCPPQWSDEEVRHLCENATSSPHIQNQTLLYKLPVSNAQGVFYKNLYCAVCHGQMQYRYWRISIECMDPASQGLVHANSSGITLLKDLLDTKSCSLSFRPPQQEVSYRPCSPVINRCASDWPDEGYDIKGGCERGHASYVYHLGMGNQAIHAYKNNYCALCNNDTRVHCFHDPMPTFNAQPPFYPLSVVLDLNVGQGSVSQSRGVSFINVSQADTKSCSKGKVFDPFQARCRVVLCRTGYRLQDDKCTKVLNSNVNSSDEYVNASDCLRITVNRTEYVLLDDDSLYINMTKELHGRGTYEIRDDQSALVCTNLTQNFTIVKVLSKPISLNFSPIQSILSVVGQIFSLIGLTILIVVYSIFSELRNLAGKNLMSLAISLFCGQLLLLTGKSASTIHSVCVPVSVLTHYFFLACFCWMNVMAFDIWKKITAHSAQSPSSKQSRQFAKYNVYGWGVPVLVTTIAIIVNFSIPHNMMSPGYGKSICWISYKPALILFFVAPVAIILTANITFFFLTVVSLWKVTKVTKMVSAESNRHLLWLYVKLSCVMGLTWIFGFIAAASDLELLWYPFIIFNSLQGTFICLSFVITNRVRGLFRERFGKASKNVSSDVPTESTSL